MDALKYRSGFICIAVYTALMFVLDGFKFQYYRINEIVFSNVVSVILADVSLYIVLWASADIHVYTPAFVVVLAGQVLLIIPQIVVVSHFLTVIARTDKVLLVCPDSSSAMRYIQKSTFYKNLFNFVSVMSPDDPELFSKAKAFHVVHMLDVSEPAQTKFLEFCLLNDCDVYVVPSLYDLSSMRSVKLQISDTLVLRFKNYYLTSEQKFLKRLMDILVSFIGLIVASPVMLAAALAIRLLDGPGVLYRQERMTIGGKVFRLYKFRTMIQNAEAQTGATLSTENDPRITKIGGFLRKVRLDELPQLWNILSGDMSIIGPRPERPVFIEQYEKDFPNFSCRLKVKAGLTGLAQVYGRYNTRPDEKLAMDLYYIANYSPILDLKILFLTLRILFCKSATDGVLKDQINWYTSFLQDERSEQPAVRPKRRNFVDALHAAGEKAGN